MKALNWIGTVLCCLVFEASAQPLRIGLIGPFSGGTSDFGNSLRFGAELAVKEINAVGGFMGRPFELVVRDDQSTPEVGRAGAEDLVLKEKVAFTIGFCNTGVVMKAIDVFQNNKHLLMIPCSQGTRVTRHYPPEQSYIFRLAPHDLLNAKFLVAEIVDRRKLSKLAIFADTTGYGEGGLQDLSAELAQRGLKPAYVARFPMSAVSLTDEMRAARDAGADAVVVYTAGPLQAAAVKDRRSVGMKAPLFAPWPLSGRNVLEIAGPAALEGTMMVQTIVHDTFNERRASFLARYFRLSREKRIGSLMAAAQTYDAVHLMLWALFQTKGDVSGDALKQALENLQRPYRGVVTTYTRPFAPNDHDAMTLNMLWLGVWRKGLIEYYYPEDARQTSYVRRKEGQ
ncbi:ABC transporter substrate-binding protein [Aquabacterium sp. A7-Y]|uniref:ABC transporter substrate-binding protein n=1 Tax=Aquabacterium sp. A7-Y TaxID=1349605 RepID=UPI00223E69F1|nr:ABC transporter substrate-binding protein [Aquabacterium sp. A7-Y]MCW7538209.1 ABC transporter substrate-binding protein [Aquabacterium sp. A7-Y]